MYLFYYVTIFLPPIFLYLPRTNIMYLSSKKVDSKTPQRQYSTEQNGPILLTNYRKYSPKCTVWHIKFSKFSGSNIPGPHCERGRPPPAHTPSGSARLIRRLPNVEHKIVAHVMNHNASVDLLCTFKSKCK